MSPVFHVRVKASKEISSCSHLLERTLYQFVMFACTGGRFSEESA